MRIVLWIIFHLALANTIVWGQTPGNELVRDLGHFVIYLVALSFIPLREDRWVRNFAEAQLQPFVPVPLVALSSIVIALLLLSAGNVLLAGLWLIANRQATLPSEAEQGRAA